MAKPAALQAIPDNELFNTAARPVSPVPPVDAHQLQAAVEGAVYGDRVDFFGEQYRISDKTGLWPLIDFARAARSGLDAASMEGLAAIGDMLEDCIDPADWPRFTQAARIHKADADDLLGVVTQTIELLSARPTSRPSGSPAGPSTTSPSSTGSSSSLGAPTGSDLVSVNDLVKQAEG